MKAYATCIFHYLTSQKYVICACVCVCVYVHTIILYRSPELNTVKPGRPVKISSEFPCSQNEHGESKGGMMLFKIQPKKSRKKPGNEIKVT